MHFDLTDLKLFIQIVESPSLTKGANKAFISPAAASMRIKALEQELNTQLLYRGSKGTTITDAGKRLLVHARLIIAQVEALKSEFASLGSMISGHIRIFANTTAVTELLPEILSEFLAKNPEVTIDLQEKGSSDIYRGISEGAADLGVTSGPELEKSINIIPFSMDRLVLVVPLGHPLENQEKTSLEESLAFPHIGLHDNSSILTFLRSRLALIGRNLPMRIQVSNFEAACRMIEAGVGIGVVPQSAANRYKKTMAFKIVQLRDDWAQRERQILLRNIKTTPICVKELVNAILSSSHKSQIDGQ